jgi:flagellar protein FlgJ
MQTAALYNDFAGLAELRHAAGRDAGSNLRTVAAEFEALFLQQALEAMREATIEGDLFQSDAVRSFREMADRQLAADLARSGGIGLADVIVRQLQAAGADGAPMLDRLTQDGLKLSAPGSLGGHESEADTGADAAG